MMSISFFSNLKKEKTRVAGHSPSIFDACRHEITVSNALNDGINSLLSAEQRGCSGSKITFKEAFWLATDGDGEVLDLPIGQL